MADCEIVVVGAGVVGLAIAQRLARGGHEVMVLEQEAWPGQHASSRNSEVIHAGIYYPPGSLKARLCRQGRDLLYAWCAEFGVTHQPIGKLLVAIETAELPALQGLQANAQANGVALQALDAAEVRAREPALRAVAGLLSPLTGIVDSHALMDSYAVALQQAGGMLQCRTRVHRVQRVAGGLQLSGDSVGQAFSLSCRRLINCGGLFAQALAAEVEGMAVEHIPALHLCQGQYFAYRGASPFSHLVYPMPEANAVGLGVHATLDLGGQVRFGPDVRYQTQLDYAMDESRRDAFAVAVQRYWPECEAEKLVPAYAGVRAKLSAAGEPAVDFVIQDSSTHAVPGLINLFGIESPGLTASLALAEEVASRLKSLYPVDFG
ncbi:NAD(P)/FAD-dependent oxidoreductase [Halopseudomonas pelagia]|uniref:NAD(P)/FAD-dependent oxidoreductase n=1 Tax=Halopseudomonas pelagia TaxID=553151 RepID=UPI0030DCF884|tara:strand:- start:372 stop:1502 length:1131 start_codon:yes stop_codon:yes gene_type:complete